MAVATFNPPPLSLEKPAQNVQALADEIAKLKGYLFELNNQLRHSLSHIDAQNFANGEAPAPASISTTVQDLLGNQSLIQQLAKRILLSVSTGTIYRAADETALLALLSAAGISLAANLLWYDTTNKLLKRCTAVGTPNVWEALQTNEVHSSSIDINTAGIYVLTGGVFVVNSANFEVSDTGMRVGFMQFYDEAGSFVMNNTATALDNVTAGIFNDHSPLLITSMGSYIQMDDPASYPIMLSQDLYIVRNCTADNYYDHTPAFTGDALTELAKVKSDGKGKIDHTSLPEAARKKLKKPPPLSSIPLDKKGHPDWKKAPPATEEDGRDIGMMVSILTKGVQQLTALVEAQQKQIDKLSSRLS